MAMTAVGVDLAKAKFDAAARRDGQYQSKVFPNTPVGFAPFQQWLAAFAEPHVCLGM